MSETRKLVLKMLQENRISIDEADQLLSAISGVAKEAPAVSPSAGAAEESLLNKIPRVDQVMGSLGSMLDSLSQQVGPGLEKRLESWFQQRTAPSSQSQKPTAPPTSPVNPMPTEELSTRHTLQVPENCQKLSYQHGLGDLKVSGHDRSEIEVHLEIRLAPGQTLPLDPSHLQITGQAADQTLTLELEGAEAFKAEHGQIQLELKVPASLDLALQTENHDILLEQLQHPQGQAHLRSRSGDLTLSNLALKQIELQSESGNIEAEQASEQLHIQTQSGDIALKGSVFDGKVRSQSGTIQIEASVQHGLKVENSSGDLQVHVLDGLGHLALQSQSGDIQLNGHLQGEVSMNSASGDLQGTLQIADSAVVSLVTHSGDVDLMLRPDSQCQLELEAQQGEVTCRLPLEGLESTAHSLRGQLGNGEGRLRARSHSGDILIS